MNTFQNVDKRFLIIILAVLILGGGFALAIRNSAAPSEPPPSGDIQVQQPETETQPRSITLSVSDDPALIEVELDDINIDATERDLNAELQVLEQEINNF